MTPKEQVEMYGYALKAMPPIQKNGKPGAIKDTFFYVENKDGVLHYAVKMESTVHTGVINASDINDVNGIKFSSLLNEGLDSSVVAVKYPRFSHSVRQKDSMLAGSKDLANSMIVADDKS